MVLPSGNRSGSAGGIPNLQQSPWRSVEQLGSSSWLLFLFRLGELLLLLFFFFFFFFSRITGLVQLKLFSPNCTSHFHTFSIKRCFSAQMTRCLSWGVLRYNLLESHRTSLRLETEDWMIGCGHLWPILVENTATKFCPTNDSVTWCFDFSIWNDKNIEPRCDLGHSNLIYVFFWTWQA